MHADIRGAAPAKCPRCGMDLVSEGQDFPPLNRMISNQWLLAAMAAVVLAVMLAIMVMVN
jgi:hypothetical protein